MPHACIGVDVIVGFPGETDEHFLETYNFINTLDISYLHVFTYSERDNTEAVNMEGVVPMNVRSKRSKMLRGLSVKKRRAFYESQLGSSRTVLILKAKIKQAIFMVLLRITIKSKNTIGTQIWLIHCTK